MYSRPIHHLSTLLRCVQKMILKNGKNNSDFYMYHRYNKPNVVGTKEEIIELLKSEMAYLNKDWNNEDFVADLFADNEIFTFDRCFNKSDFETFVEYYTTPKGEDVVAFGYCGYDG